MSNEVAATLAHSLVTADGASPTQWMVFLHGIFGSGANWRTFARRFVTARPAWGAAMVDLRMHGASLSLPPPHTVARAADDVVALEAVIPGPVRAVVGHSFGGKVALEYAARRADALDHAWILDAMPGPRTEGRGSESTLGVLASLEAMEPRVPTREGFIARMQTAGYSKELAQWLAMNLRRDVDDYVFKLDLAAIRALLTDYFARDDWNVLEQPPGRVVFHVVRGGRSQVFGPDDARRLDRAAEAHPGRVRVHVLPDAGHWVHVDDPEGLFAALLAGVPA